MFNQSNSDPEAKQVFRMQDGAFEPLFGFKISDERGPAAEVAIANRNFLVKLKNPVWLISTLLVLSTFIYLGIKNPVLLFLIALPLMLIFLVYRMIRDLIFSRTYLFELKTSRTSIREANLKTEFLGTSDADFTEGTIHINNEAFKIELAGNSFQIRDSENRVTHKMNLSYLGWTASLIEEPILAAVLSQVYPDLDLIRTGSNALIASAKRSRFLEDVASPASYKLSYFDLLTEIEQAILFFGVALVARKGKEMAEANAANF